jgi:hypothetical protein
MDAHPNVAFGGESAGRFHQMGNMFFSYGANQPEWVTEDANKKAKDGQHLAGYLRADEEEWQEACRNLFRVHAGAVEGVHDIFGWKEVAFGGGPASDKFFTSVHTIFPEARFVFLTRPVEKVVPSILGKTPTKFWRKYAIGGCAPGVEKRVRQQRRSYDDYHAKEPERTARLTYNQLTDPDFDLSEVVGFEVDPELRRKVLEVNPNRKANPDEYTAAPINADFDQRENPDPRGKVLRVRR